MANEWETVGLVGYSGMIAAACLVAHTRYNRWKRAVLFLLGLALVPILIVMVTWELLRGRNETHNDQ